MAERDSEPRDERTSRRGFLGRVAVVSGSTIAAATGLAEAELVRRRPVLIDRLGSSTRVSAAFQRLKEAGALGPRAEAGWAQPLSTLSPPERLAAVSVLEISQREGGSAEAGAKVAAMFSVLAVGLAASAAGGVYDPKNPPSVEAMAAFREKSGLRANGAGCGSGCGTGCQGAQRANGLGCGSGCGTGCQGPGGQASGFICGNNCQGPGTRGEWVFDEQGTALGKIDITSVNLLEMSAAMDGAAQAYARVFK